MCVDKVGRSVELWVHEHEHTCKHEYVLHVVSVMYLPLPYLGYCNC